VNHDTRNRKKISANVLCNASADVGDDLLAATGF
jgi:hypothetical protein